MLVAEHDVNTTRSRGEQSRQAQCRHAAAAAYIERLPRTNVLQGVREERRDDAPDGRVHHQAHHQQLPGLRARRHNPAQFCPLIK